MLVLVGPPLLQIQTSRDKCHVVHTAVSVSWRNSRRGNSRLGRFTGFSVFSGFIFKPFFFGLAFTKTGKPSLRICLLSSPETRS
jgi:hypothetical protein